MSDWSWSKMGSGAMMNPPPGRDSCRSKAHQKHDFRRYTSDIQTKTSNTQSAVVNTARIVMHIYLYGRANGSRHGGGALTSVVYRSRPKALNHTGL
jgi:hypothetical protein